MRRGARAMSRRRSIRQTGRVAERSAQEITAFIGGPSMTAVVEETTMDWMNRFRGSGRAEPADPADETVINGAPYDAPKEIRDPAAPGDPSDADNAEE